MSSIDDLPVPDYLGRLRLDGKGFVVIGAGQGMGRQTAHALAQAGAAKVVCVDVDPDRAQQIADEIGVGVPWSGDCTKRDEVARLAADAEAALGRIDAQTGDNRGLSRSHPTIRHSSGDPCHAHPKLRNPALRRDRRHRHDHPQSSREDERLHHADA
jgi:hypothetical protein